MVTMPSPMKMPLKTRRSSDEIRIVCSGNDHRDRPNFDQRPTGDASTNLPASVPQSDLPEPSARPRTNRQVRIIRLQLDIWLGCNAMGRSVDKGDATENSRPRSKTCSKALMKLQTKPTGGSP